MEFLGNKNIEAQEKRCFIKLHLKAQLLNILSNTGCNPRVKEANSNVNLKTTIKTENLER